MRVLLQLGTSAASLGNDAGGSSQAPSGTSRYDPLLLVPVKGVHSFAKQVLRSRITNYGGALVRILQHVGAVLAEVALELRPRQHAVRFDDALALGPSRGRGSIPLTLTVCGQRPVIPPTLVGPCRSRCAAG
jgi:hypothetical protein